MSEVIKNCLKTVIDKLPNNLNEYQTSSLKISLQFSEYDDSNDVDVLKILNYEFEECVDNTFELQQIDQFEQIYQNGKLINEYK